MPTRDYRETKVKKSNLLIMENIMVIGTKCEKGHSKLSKRASGLPSLKDHSQYGQERALVIPNNSEEWDSSWDL